MAGFVTVRAYTELNDFVDADSRGQTLHRPFQDRQTVKDAFRGWAFRTPRIDLILVNGPR